VDSVSQELANDTVTFDVLFPEFCAALRFRGDAELLSLNFAWPAVDAGRSFSIRSTQNAANCAAKGNVMSEAYTIEDHRGSIAGIVVRQAGERGFRFVSSARAYDAMDGHVFVSAQAAQRAAHEIARCSVPRYRVAMRQQGAAA
jgi:hypothetical protein